jgi:hypothetical protein
MIVPKEEIAPGLVLYLDTAVLRALGGSLTNAVIGPEGDRAVAATHLFLVLHVDGPARQCTAVPLFEKSAVGNQPLVESLKSGAATGWIGTTVFFSRWQHWRIPLDAASAASADDDSTTSTRRRYANGDGSTLDDIRNWEGRNRASYRPA